MRRDHQSGSWIGHWPLLLPLLRAEHPTGSGRLPFQFARAGYEEPMARPAASASRGLVLLPCIEVRSRGAQALRAGAALDLLRVVGRPLRTKRKSTDARGTTPRRDWPGSWRVQDPGRRLDHLGPYSGEFGALATAWDCFPPEISTRSCRRPRQSAERQAPILPRRRESTISSEKRTHEPGLRGRGRRQRQLCKTTRRARPHSYRRSRRSTENL